MPDDWPGGSSYKKGGGDVSEETNKQGPEMADFESRCVDEVAPLPISALTPKFRPQQLSAFIYGGPRYIHSAYMPPDILHALHDVFVDGAKKHDEWERWLSDGVPCGGETINEAVQYQVTRALIHLARLDQCDTSEDDSGGHILHAAARLLMAECMRRGLR